MLQQLYTSLMLYFKALRVTRYEGMFTFYTCLECARLKTMSVLFLQHFNAVPDSSILFSSISETNLEEQMSWWNIPCAASL
jgi:hypothetical protein